MNVQTLTVTSLSTSNDSGGDSNDGGGDDSNDDGGNSNDGYGGGYYSNADDRVNVNDGGLLRENRNSEEEKGREAPL
jgi:hypothetical protein